MGGAKTPTTKNRAGQPSWPHYRSETVQHAGQAISKHFQTPQEGSHEPFKNPDRDPKKFDDKAVAVEPTNDLREKVRRPVRRYPFAAQIQTDLQFALRSPRE